VTCRRMLRAGGPVSHGGESCLLSLGHTRKEATRDRRVSGGLRTGSRLREARPSCGRP
jgi:hypothetical protein